MAETVLEQAPLSEVRPELQQRVTAMRDGRSMAALRAERASVREELFATGQVRVATIVNFNPVWLKVTAPFPYKVPPCNYKGRGEEMKIIVEHEGRKFVGSYLTITEPYLYPKIRGTKRDDGTGDDVGDYAIKHVLPLGIVMDFWTQYNKSQDQPMAMGGILIFEGDKHAIAKKPEKIKFPVAKMLPNGDRVYFTEDNNYNKVLTDLFKVQRAFIGSRINQARAYWVKPETQADVTDEGHRVWGEFALEHGYGLETKEPWMYDSPTSEVPRCEACGLPRKETKAHFCQGCNAPYDAYASFMAGKPVPEQYLYSLQGKQLEDVRTEMKRRKALFADVKP